MPITWDSQEPQTATTSPGNLGQTLGNMLPMPERPPPQDPASTFGQAPVDYLSALSSWTSPVPSPPSENTLAAGRTLARYGVPAVSGFVGASGGPLTAGLASAGGELAGQWAAGDPINLPAVGLSGALGAAGNLAGRAVSGLARAGRSLLPSSNAAIDAAVTSGERVPMSNIRSAIDDVLETGARGGVGVGREPTAGFEKLRQFATKFEATTRTEMPMQDVAAMRDELGQLLVELRQGSPAFHKAQALYGALMSDLRQGVATGSAPSAADYLTAMTDKHIAHAMVPESMLERILLYGLGGAAAYGHPGALWPAAGLLGVRAYRATPPSVLDQIGAGAATLANPYRRE